MEGIREFNIAYLGYVEAVVKIPQIHGYDECVPLLVLPTTPYSTKVRVQFGTTLINRAMQKINPEESAKTDTTWQQSHMSTVITAKAASAANEFDAMSIDSTLNTTKPVVIPSFQCRRVKGLTANTGHSLRVRVVAEPLHQPIANGVAATRTYFDLRPGSI